jgi:hypothetical protein
MRSYYFKLVENGTGRERAVHTKAPTMQEAISTAYLKASTWLGENSKTWNIVLAQDTTHAKQDS